MAALTANASRTFRNTVGKTRHTYTVKTNSTIFKHALVGVDVSANLAKRAADDATTRFAGIAIENSTGTFPMTGNGTKTVTVYNNLEVQLVLETNVTKAKILSPMYATTDQDIAFSSTGGAECGQLTEWVAANDGYVFLGRKALITGT